MFFKLTRYVLARSLTKLIAPELAQGRVSDLNHEIERLTLENLALSHENRILRRSKKKISFTRFDRLLLGWFSVHLDDWEHVLITAKPATVRGWWLQRWNIFWGEISRGSSLGRPPVSSEIIALIKRLARDNPAWGVPRIQGELRMLGMKVARATIRKYLPKRSSTPEQRQRWRTFIRNHLDVTVAMDFFSLKTAKKGEQLYLWFLIHHGTREILFWNITEHPTSAWVSQQLREAFPGDRPLPDFLICDRDSIFSSDVRQGIKHLGIEPKQTSFRSPWQNAYAERFVGTCRRDVFDWVIVFGERHARKLMQEFVAYYHDDRTHLGLFGETPKHRTVHLKQPNAKLTALSRLGGLHHRYGWDTHSKSDENSARRAA